MIPAFALARLFWSLSARAAVPLVMPVFFGILVVASILFGPTGMRAADAVFTMRSTLSLAIFLWLAWIVLTLPASRVALWPPSANYLRWLPVSRFVLYAAAGTSVLVVQLPWMVLFGRAEGFFAAMTAGLGAVALHAASVTRPLGLSHVFVIIAWAVSAFNPWPSIALPGACVAAVLAVKTAIDRAAEVGAAARRPMRLRSPVKALAAAHLVYLIRVEPAALARTFILSVIAAVILPLAARGHDLELPQSFGALSLGLSSIALPVGLSGIASASIRSERAAAWICDATGTTATTRAFSAALAVASIGAAAGGLLGATSCFLLSASPIIAARIFLIPMIFGFFAGATLAGFARESEASPRRGDRAMVQTLIITALGAVSASLWGEMALMALVFFAIFLVLVAPNRANVIRRKRGAS